ncbi:MAG: hypothetical protein WC738_00175 [Candidatus Omnitrophota bacterium]|jgi:hypothetical protein
MRRTISWILVFFMLANLTGCEALSKKFRRKPKKTVKAPRLYQVKKYEKKPTPELYKKHYAYWESWQSELIQVLGQNRKKDLLCIDQIISNLQDMQNMLVPEKGKEMESHIQRLITVKGTIINTELTKANAGYVLRILEREDRLITKCFAYRKVKDFLKKSFEDDAKTTPAFQPVASGEEPTSEPKSVVRISD